jgi:hypothetical protein
MLWWSLGQQESCDEADCETAQSVDIKGDAPAKATTVPCKPMASNTMSAMS